MFAYWFYGIAFWTCVTINHYEIALRKPDIITLSGCEIYEYYGWSFVTIVVSISSE